MNARKYGMPGLPVIFAPYESGTGMKGKHKKNPVKPKTVGCQRCGALGVTLRWNRSKTRKVCQKCYERGNS